MKKIWGDLYTFLIASLVFVTPLNLFFKFSENTAYVGGLFVDYLVPKVFLSDILIVCLLVCWLLEQTEVITSGKAWQIIKTSTTNAQNIIGLTFIAILLFFFRQLTALKPLIAVLQLWNMSAFMGLLLFTQAKSKLLFNSSLVIAAFLASIIFQSFIGLYQFAFQKSLTPYQLFGETQLLNVAGISKLEIQGVLHIAPYGTTSHPNVLAGVLVFYMLIAFIFYKSQTQSIGRKLTFAIAIISGLLTIALTFSISAWIALAVGLLTLSISLQWQRIIGWGNIVLFTLTPLLLELLQWLTQSTSLSLLRRVILNSAALEMWFGHMLLGVGLQNFTVHTEKFASTSINEVVRFLQPVHHIGLLWLSETGLLGIVVALLLVFLISKVRKKYTLLTSLVVVAPLVPIASLDHYLLTSHTGWLLVVWWASVRSWQRMTLNSQSY